MCKVLLYVFAVVLLVLFLKAVIRFPNDCVRDGHVTICRNRCMAQEPLELDYMSEDSCDNGDTELRAEPNKTSDFNNTSHQ